MQEKNMHYLNDIVVIDFETTGLSPYCSRVIEVAAIRMHNGSIVDSFEFLMDPGIRISSFITDYTGISNEMVRGKPSPEEVMPHLLKFVGDSVLIAHNASFDKKFYDIEMSRVNLRYDSKFLCTLLLSRRLIQGLGSYRLENIAINLGIKNDRYHRALGDVEVTGKIWSSLYSKVAEITGRDFLSFDLLKKISEQPKKNVFKYLNSI